ncbi:hypothetical protein F443_07951 [Phytophthora nicotianae P1569]|uniref:Uncharacterized protein n=1 Tax=Phytophthora nicotianae P1569 TaxID=1317065 RepID=V9F8V5_PHYNI|nr:hypothetical protein F443_07951 [Phytophthora nicotianae P1569]
MKKLTFLHLGAHMMLPKLPDVAGLTNLRSILMARLEALDSLPEDFAQLTRLEIMLVLAMPRLKTFPDLTPTAILKEIPVEKEHKLKRYLASCLIIQPQPELWNSSSHLTRRYA